jgi:RNA polymerase sigma-70 factor (ECF subfamily)
MSPEERFDALWRDHARGVLRYARRRVPPDDVDDVVAETFVVAWRRIDAVPDPALPWLLGVARRVASNVARAARRRHALAGRVGATREHDPRRSTVDPVADSDPEAGPVVSALQRMREGDRELLTLIAWDGLSAAEAARVVGCSDAALRVRLHRARRRFSRLAGLDSGDDPGRGPGLAARLSVRRIGGSL